MRISRSSWCGAAVAALGVMCAAVLLLAAPVGAQNYTGGALVINPSTLVQSGALAATVTGCPSRTNVVFTLDGPPTVSLGEAVTDNSGTVTISTTVPADLAPGPHAISATCGGLTLITNVQVIAPSATTTSVVGPLPVTGADSAKLWRIGSGLFLVGALLVGVSIGVVRWRSIAKTR